MAGQFSKRRHGRGGRVGPGRDGRRALLFSSCSGCNSKPPYPPNLAFPPRTDRLVLKLPDKPAPKIDAVDERDKDIAALDSLGGRTADPATIPAEKRDPLNNFLKDTFGTPAEPRHNSFAQAHQAHLSEGSRLPPRHRPCSATTLWAMGRAIRRNGAVPAVTTGRCVQVCHERRSNETARRPTCFTRSTTG